MKRRTEESSEALPQTVEIVAQFAGRVFGFSELAGSGLGLQMRRTSRQFRKTEHPTPVCRLMTMQTIDMVLNAYELAQRLKPLPDFRHRIEHCTLVNPDLLQRIAQIGAIPTPFYTYVYYHGDKWAQYGQERTRSMFAHRSFLDHGIRVAGASDYVPGPFEPMMAIQSMVTRKDYQGRVGGENQRITVGEALKICTLNGAYASSEEHLKGSISPGKLADFVLLADDPHTHDPDRIKEIRVVRTVVGGQTVFPLSG